MIKVTNKKQEERSHDFTSLWIGHTVHNIKKNLKEDLWHGLWIIFTARQYLDGKWGNYKISLITKSHNRQANFHQIKHNYNIYLLY